MTVGAENHAQLAALLGLLNQTMTEFIDEPKAEWLAMNGDDVIHGTRKDKNQMKLIKERGIRLLTRLFGDDHRHVKDWVKIREPIRLDNQPYRTGAARVLRGFEGILLSVKDELEEDSYPIQLAHVPPERFFDQLHPEIKAVSAELFSNQHYSLAIQQAFIALNNFVKNKSGFHDLDGQALMARAFADDGTCLRLNAFQTQSQKDEQKGFQFLYMGAMTGIRNPKAHEIFDLKDPMRALKYLALASLLFERAEEAHHKED